MRLLRCVLLAGVTTGLVVPPTPSTNVVQKAASMPMDTTSFQVEVVEPKFDLAAYFGKKVAAIERALDASLVAESPNTDKIVEAMRYSLLAGGKRIRPVMCIAACEMFGGTEEQAMPTAVAIEMIHSAEIKFKFRYSAT